MRRPMLTDGLVTKAGTVCRMHHNIQGGAFSCGPAVLERARRGCSARAPDRRWTNARPAIRGGRARCGRVVCLTNRCCKVVAGWFSC